MLTSGDVVEIDFGGPSGSEAGMARPAIVVTARRILAAEPRVIHVVPLTRTLRAHAAEVRIEADAENGLETDSAAQCQHIRAVSAVRAGERLGNVGPVALARLRDTIAVLLDL